MLLAEVSVVSSTARNPEHPFDGTKFYIDDWSSWDCSFADTLVLAKYIQTPRVKRNHLLLAASQHKASKSNCRCCIFVEDTRVDMVLWSLQQPNKLNFACFLGWHSCQETIWGVFKLDFDSYERSQDFETGVLHRISSRFCLAEWFGRGSHFWKNPKYSYLGFMQGLHPLPPAPLTPF